jgi:predicted ABC-type sugar transport system permease subunit
MLYAMAAPITGGVSVFGGRGNVLGVLGGVLLLTVIQVGLSIISVPSFYVGMNDCRCICSVSRKPYNSSFEEVLSRNLTEISSRLR